VPRGLADLRLPAQAPVPKFSFGVCRITEFSARHWRHGPLSLVRGAFACADAPVTASRQPSTQILGTMNRTSSPPPGPRMSGTFGSNLSCTRRTREVCLDRLVPPAPDLPLRAEPKSAPETLGASFLLRTPRPIAAGEQRIRTNKEPRPAEL
jgi:hypothetical protein